MYNIIIHVYYVYMYVGIGSIIPSGYNCSTNGTPWPPNSGMYQSRDQHQWATETYHPVWIAKRSGPVNKEIKLYSIGGVDVG